MKLITEVFEEIQYLSEENDGGEKSYYIEGIFLQSEIKNRNGRLYPKGIMEREVERYNREHVKENRAYGELGHPQGPIINGHLISHRIVELKQDRNNFIGKARILDTPNGNIVKTLLKDGGKLGVSSRGMGSLRERNGINEVQDDFYLATAADIVMDPSAPDAFVQGIMEGVDWILESGTWVPRFVEKAQTVIHNTSKEDLTETKIAVFESFMKKLSENS